ncbi:hypothetical protein SIID45300_02991 [Candidatus Magnetaquicoccaceae bacterium FCR-1]|uniref:Uncharacterized protein n=1 Tax=Candidatus Magnetaquiglobus chichijimensis TaxID=3141448 RepID=A0ABQ0CCL6_9PROT
MAYREERAKSNVTNVKVAGRCPAPAGGDNRPPSPVVTGACFHRRSLFPPPEPVSPVPTAPSHHYSLRHGIIGTEEIEFFGEPSINLSE